MVNRPAPHPRVDKCETTPPEIVLRSCSGYCQNRLGLLALKPRGMSPSRLGAGHGPAHEHRIDHKPGTDEPFW